MNAIQTLAIATTLTAGLLAGGASASAQEAPELPEDVEFALGIEQEFNTCVEGIFADYDRAIVDYEAAAGVVGTFDRLSEAYIAVEGPLADAELALVEAAFVAGFLGEDVSNLSELETAYDAAYAEYKAVAAAAEAEIAAIEADFGQPYPDGKAYLDRIDSVCEAAFAQAAAGEGKSYDDVMADLDTAYEILGPEAYEQRVAPPPAAAPTQ